LTQGLIWGNFLIATSSEIPRFAGTPARLLAGFVFLGLRFSKQIAEMSRGESAAAHPPSLP
jgi:hypothetical protein